MTSSGQLTIPENAPARAPETGTTHSWGSCVAQYSRGPVGVLGSWAEAAVSGVETGDVGFLSKDILGGRVVGSFTEYAFSSESDNAVPSTWFTKPELLMRYPAARESFTSNIDARHKGGRSEIDELELSS